VPVSWTSAPRPGPGVRHVRLVSDEAGERDAGDYTTRVEREVVVDREVRVDHLVADAVSLARHDVNLAVEIQDAHRTQEDAALRLDDASARERGVVQKGPSVSWERMPAL